MKNELSAEMKAQSIVENTMGDITRATRKVLMDYVSNMYLVSFAKAIAYLGLESEDANSLLNTMNADTRRQVPLCQYSCRLVRWQNEIYNKF